MKNDIQNENFRLRMQKTMLDFVIQNTKYKIQNTNTMMIHDRNNAQQLKLNTCLKETPTYLKHLLNST